MNSRYEQAMIDVKNEHSDDLLALEDVHTVAIGRKVTNGLVQEEISIVIFTTNKKAPIDIPDDQWIPSHLHGIPTDVIEAPRFVPYLEPTQNVPNRERYRPIPGGVQIYMPTSINTGGYCTLGMYARSTAQQDDPSNLYLLANAHCFPRADQRIYQPNDEHESDWIANASRIVNSALVDGGIAQLRNPTDAEPNEILGIGVPRSTVSLSIDDLGTSVIKSGRTTGTTIGLLAYLHADADDKKDQIIIVDQSEVFSDHGDSGSIVLFDEGSLKHHVIGLLWGGALIYTVLCPIQAVCEELKIDLLTEP